MMVDTDNTQKPLNSMDDVTTYIQQHTDQPLDREQLAALTGFSVPHFHRIFTAEIGENIAAYVRRVRLERAANKFIMGAVDITEVALAAGYQTHAAFSKAFKQHYGYTPSQFRKLNFMIALQTIRERRPHDKNNAD